MIKGTEEANILEGGKGYDTYYAGNGDTIIDSDNDGEVLFELPGGTLLNKLQGVSAKLKIILCNDSSQSIKTQSCLCLV